MRIEQVYKDDKQYGKIEVFCDGEKVSFTKVNLHVVDGKAVPLKKPVLKAMTDKPRIPQDGGRGAK